MRRLPILLIFAAAFSSTVSCRRGNVGKEGAFTRRQNNPLVTYVNENDTRLREASRQAQQSLDSFVQTLAQPQPNHSSHAIKAVFQDDGSSEAIWLTSLRHDGKTFHGTVSNEPVHLRTLHLGSKVEVENAKVNDWMLVENGRLVGGYSIRVVRDNLQGEDRKRFDQTMPFAFE